MASASDKQKLDEEGDVSPFANVQKNVVLRNVSVFNEARPDPRKCSQVLTHLLYFLSQGDAFTPAEVTDVFFQVTKLLQSQNVHLRRLTYLVIKELNVSSDEAFIVVNSLSKDMTSKTDLFRGNAIRVLATIIDAGTLGQLDRFLKGAVVDKNPFVVSSALVAGLKLFQRAPDIVKRWVSEVQSALDNKNQMAAFHALSLLHKIKGQDRLALSKLVTDLARSQPRGATAQCLLMRLVAKVLASQGVEAELSGMCLRLLSGSRPDPALINCLTENLHNKHSRVSLEAARALCCLENLDASALKPAINVLQEFLASHIPVCRFAAVRVLSGVVARQPELVQQCVRDLEHLITDSNRSIATLAITTLLKTGVEASVDRVMKTVHGFIGEIPDEFKIVLVDAIKALSIKFPHKHAQLVGFLGLTALREEGGLAYKKAIFEAMLEVAEKVPEAKETVIDHFCEFIEDCEYPSLCVSILHVLGEEGPRLPHPDKCVRFIFNRVILETTCVRAAAISAMAKYALTGVTSKQNIRVLLERCLNDSDGEVRDRAIYFLHLLNQNNEEACKTAAAPALKVPLADVTHSLRLYLKKPHAAPFSLQKHLVHAAVEKKEEVAEKKEELPEIEVTNTLGHIPEVQELGPLFSTSAPVRLTEEESEYVVSYTKHVFAEHVLLQFNVTNQMEDQQLVNVTVEVELAEDGGWEEQFTIPAEKIDFNECKQSYTCLGRAEGVFGSESVGCVLRFEYREVLEEGHYEDPVEDTYELEEMQIVESDFVRPFGSSLGLGEFRRRWEALSAENEMSKKFSLGLSDLQPAVEAVIKLIGLLPCENSGHVPEDKRSHAVNLYGEFVGGFAVFARGGFMLDQKHGVTLKIAVRCENPTVRELLVNCVR